MGEWQAELDKLATSVVLNREFNPSQNLGFVPARYKDVEAGFEFSLVDTASLLKSYSQLKNQVRQFDTAAVFTCLFYDPQDDILMSGEESKLYARNVVDEIDKMSRP